MTSDTKTVGTMVVSGYEGFLSSAGGADPLKCTAPHPRGPQSVQGEAVVQLLLFVLAWSFGKALCHVALRVRAASMVAIR